MTLEPGSLLPLIGVVSGLGGLVGSFIGNRVHIEYIKEKLQTHDKRLDDHSLRIRQHDIVIGSGAGDK